MTDLNWSDIWVLNTLRITLRDDGTLDLPRFVAAADGINKAIMTSEEFNNGIHRLRAHGLLQTDGDRIFLSKSGAKTPVKRLEEKFEVTPWHSGYDCGRLKAPDEFISSDRFEDAIKAYQRKTRR